MLSRSKSPTHRIQPGTWVRQKCVLNSLLARASLQKKLPVEGAEVAEKGQEEKGQDNPLKFEVKLPLGQWAKPENFEVKLRLVRQGQTLQCSTKDPCKGQLRKHPQQNWISRQNCWGNTR